MLKPATPEAMTLLMQGARAFARMEEHGLHIDEAYLDTAIQRVKREIAEREQALNNAPEMSVWLKHHGNDTNTGSNKQLGHVIFDLLGHKRNPQLLRKFRDEEIARNEEDDHETNAEHAFDHLDLEFTRNLFTTKKLKKALSTYLSSFKREVVDGVLHPFYDLHTTKSYRPSGSRPNLLNQPRRNKLISEIVRSCIVPREGCVFLEADYSSQEVRVSGCYNKDPVLINYVTGGGDMHRDWGKKLFLVDDSEFGPSEVFPGKSFRDVTKNKFVFPNNYGSYYCLTAPDVWDLASQLKLITAQGVPIFEHLKRKGITHLGACNPDYEPRKGSFEAHVKSVEKVMWEETFKVYHAWKQDWWSLYQRQGGVNTLTGFLMEGVFARNQVLCDPIQGSAFHCLLWSLIKIQDEFIKRKLRTRILLQIYDAILMELPPGEIPEVMEIVKYYAVELIAKVWPWLIVPLNVEFELAEGTWFNKKPLKAA